MSWSLAKRGTGELPPAAAGDAGRAPHERGDRWPDVCGSGPRGHVRATAGATAAGAHPPRGADPPWYRVIAEATADCIPGAESAVIPAARHMAIVENPSASADLVARFIERH